MVKETLFISDLHLTIEKPYITQRFLTFLKQRASQAETLYILGDFFDTWVGDDDQTPPIKTVKQALQRLTEEGVTVYLQHGNRDFLIGEKFCADTGVRLVEDHHMINLYGKSILLMHGDLLCTDDIAYQAFRNKSRSLGWQQNVLSKPLLIRLLAARWYRFKSYLHKRDQEQMIMDVNQSTVATTMQQYQADYLIHGHTHRQGIHEVLLNDKKLTRIVLPEWSQTTCEVLVLRGEEFSFHKC
ncbi:MAG: UDP-2,3-diacylglucosamine diphosphatase [Methylococcaceae bacterium]